jgi:hypothetical protein
MMTLKNPENKTAATAMNEKAVKKSSKYIILIRECRSIKGPAKNPVIILGMILATVKRASVSGDPVSR